MVTSAGKHMPGYPVFVAVNPGSEDEKSVIESGATPILIDGRLKFQKLPWIYNTLRLIPESKFVLHIDADTELTERIIRSIATVMTVENAFGIPELQNGLDIPDEMGTLLAPYIALKRALEIAPIDEFCGWCRDDIFLRWRLVSLGLTPLRMPRAWAANHHDSRARSRAYTVPHEVSANHALILELGYQARGLYKISAKNAEEMRMK